MLSLKQLAIDGKATLGDTVILCRTAATVAYADGVPTSKRDGTRYTVAVPKADMATINIKVPGTQTVNLDGKSVIPVTFDDLEIYIYFRDGKPMIAGRATAIHVVDKL